MNGEPAVVTAESERLGAALEPALPTPSKVVIGVPVALGQTIAPIESARRHADNMKARHGVGQLLLAGAAISYGIIRIAEPFESRSYYYGGEEIFVIQAVASALFLGALCAQLLGFLAAAREWRSTIAFMTFGYGIVVLAVMVFASYELISWSETNCNGPAPCPSYPSTWVDELFRTAGLMLGSLLLMEGGTYMALSRPSGMIQASMAAGSIAFLGGAFASVYMLAPIGYFLTAAASAIVGIIWIIYSQLPG